MNYLNFGKRKTAVGKDQATQNKTKQE
jgi:hypothetical protein